MFGVNWSRLPFSSFPIADSDSVADPLLGILSDPSIRREFLLRATPKSGGSPVNVDLSSSGYISDPADSPYKLFYGCIGRPYNFSIDLPLPDLKGGGSSAAGEIRINNPDALRDTEALYDWLGVDSDIYIGQKSEALTLFTRFFHGKSAGVTWDLNSWSILHRDLRFRLQRRLQTNRYKGTGSCLRFDGVNDYAQATTTVSCPAGSMTLECDLTPLTSYASQVAVAGWRNGSAAGNRLILYSSTLANAITLAVRNDAATQYTITATSALTIGQRYKITLILDVPNLLLKLYIDGEEAATPVAVTGTFNTTLTNFTLARQPDGSSQFNNCEIDEVAIWNIVRTQASIQSTMGKELTGTETGLTWYAKLNEATGTVAAPSVGSGNLTITGATWVGSREGDSSLAGTVKPVLLGKKRQISPKLVDSQFLVYQIHDGSINAINDVKDGGDTYTFGSNLSDIYSATPSAGTYNTCLSKGLFRLGSSPVGVITCDAQGDDSGALGYTNNVADIHRKLATTYGGLSDSDLNLLTYSALEAKTSAVIGFYFDEEINIDAAMDEIMSCTCCWWVPDRVGKLNVGRIEDPSTLTPETSITEDDIVDPDTGGIFHSEPLGVRVGQVVLGYRRYNTVLSDEQVAGVLTLLERADLGQEYRYVTSIDPDRSDDADTMTVYTEFDSVSDAQAEADRLLGIWKVDRRIQTLSLDQGTLSYFIQSVFDVTLDRYDLTSGKTLIVVGISEDMGEYGSVDSLQVKLFG